MTDYLHLRDPDARRRGDVFVVEGRVALERVVDGGLEVRSVLLTPPRAEQLADLLGRLDRSAPVLVADRSVLAATAGYDVHRGILAIAARPGPVPVTELLQRGDGVTTIRTPKRAKGGIVLAIEAQLGIPVKLVGLGEAAGDLVEFDADEFVEALFS